MTIAYKIDLSPEINYQPQGTLCIDARAIPPEDMRSLRQWHTQQEAADRIGVSQTRWMHMEQGGVPAGPMAAAMRELWMGGAGIERTRATCGMVKAVADVCGGYPTLADELHAKVWTVRGWGVKGAAVRGWAGPLISWLFAEMGLTEVDALDQGEIQSTLTRRDIHDIRARAASGEAYKGIARDHGVTRAHISHIVRGQRGAWAGGGQ